MNDVLLHGYAQTRRMQITGIGPTGTTYAKRAADPRKARRPAAAKVTRP